MKKWDTLQNVCYRQTEVAPYPGLKIAGMNFEKPYIKCDDCDLIVYAVMRLLIKYAYTTESDYGKFTIGYVLKRVGGDVGMTIGSAIPFREDGKDLPYPYTLIKQFVMQKAEEYADEKITRVFIRIYLSGLKSSAAPYISDLDLSNRIREFILKFNENEAVVPREARKIGDSKRDYTQHMTALKVGSRERQPFIVADIETLLIDDVHVPYAVGFLVVRPGESISEDIPTYFSEDVPPTVFEAFEDRSNKILFDFIERIAFVVKKDRSIKNVYFHNFSRFDGIILLKYFATRGKKYRINPLMRNHRLYELKVYRGKRLLFSIRDSLTLLPGSLNSLARNLCPHLGSKGSIPHDQVRLSNLMNLRYELLEYMKQDIRLLGGVMLKAQEIYFEEYKIDIVKKLTVSSLAMTIYRTHFYNPKTFPIHIPNRNEDTFIRRGYYGGHSDSYIPKGEDLKYYDVNSLYPYIMKTFPMPCGAPVWHENLEDQDLDSLFGYFEAHIVCPPQIMRPFLPYRDPKTKTIQFPTGEFVGVYFSEELKYAREIGYQVTLLSGYSFKEMNSPFEGFVNTSYDKRQAAKREGNDAMSYVYKILMNSLYGRFGISPDCSITEVCDFDRYQFLLKNTNFTSADKLSEHNYIITYLTNSGDVSDWSAPRIAAVQMAAAITAWARIYMHPYISRHDCYYTDTDSVVLRSPLPEDVISSTELGKFKLEYNVMEGIFLAPKSYLLKVQDGKNILKFKGPAKEAVSEEWFEYQHKDIHKTTPAPVISHFKIDWNKLNIIKKESIVELGIRTGTKREFIFDENGNLVDTVPLVVKDLAGQDKRILEYKLKKLKEANAQKDREIEAMRYQMGLLPDGSHPLEVIDDPEDQDREFDKLLKSQMAQLPDGKRLIEILNSHEEKDREIEKLKSQMAQLPDGKRLIEILNYRFHEPFPDLPQKDREIHFLKSLIEEYRPRPSNPTLYKKPPKRKKKKKRIL